MWRLVLIGILLVTIPAGWLVYSFGRDGVIAEITAQADAKNEPALTGRIDWPALQAFMKQDIAAQKAAMGSYGTSIGPAASRIDAVVDYYVTAENVPLLFHYHDLWFAGVPAENFIEEAGFSPPFGFYIILAYPRNAPQTHNIQPLLKDRLKARVVFRLTASGWRVREMHVPLFMVPSQTHNLPAIQLFGKKR